MGVRNRPIKAQIRSMPMLIDGDKKLSWRKLTPLECERLQTVPDGYTLVIEDGQAKGV